MVGAHLDSVLEGPGINDNGSGVAAVLEIARGVAEGGIPDGTAVRIGLWGGEELGLVGSRAYVQSLEDDPVAYLNIDMAGSLNGANFVYNEVAVADQSGGITQGYVQWLTERGEVPEPIDLHGASDHGSFQRGGHPDRRPLLRRVRDGVGRESVGVGLGGHAGRRLLPPCL